MKIYTFFSLVSVISQLSNCIKIRPKLQRNILNFGYGINYKYEGILVHSFDRFYVVTKFILPTIGDIKFSKLNFDHTCTYMKKEYIPNTDSRKYLTELRTYCNKVKPFVSYYSKLIHSYNKTAHNILQKWNQTITTPGFKTKTWNYHHISVNFHWFSLWRDIKFLSIKTWKCFTQSYKCYE